MARVDDIHATLKEYEQKSGGGGFFSLKNDKDTAVVRFLHTDEQSLDVFTAHSVEINGKKRWVDCLATEQNGGSCPLCKTGDVPQLKIFLQLYDKTDNQQKIWERGRQIIPKILGQMKRNGDLNSMDYEIERNGAAGSKETTYELYPMIKTKDTDIEDLPEPQKMSGSEETFVITLPEEEMIKRIQNNWASSEQSNFNTQPRTAPRQEVDPTNMF